MHDSGGGTTAIDDEDEDDDVTDSREEGRADVDSDEEGRVPFVCAAGGRWCEWWLPGYPSYARVVAVGGTAAGRVATVEDDEEEKEEEEEEEGVAMGADEKGCFGVAFCEEAGDWKGLEAEAGEEMVEEEEGVGGNTID